MRYKLQMAAGLAGNTTHSLSVVPSYAMALRKTKGDN